MNNRRAVAAANASRGRMVKQTTPFQEARTVVGDAYRRGTQFISGLLENTIANSATDADIQAQVRQRDNQIASWLPDPVQAVVELTTGREGYRPAAMEQPGALYGIIQAVLPGVDDPNSYGQRSLERVGVAQERTREALGTTQPQDAIDMFLTGAGAMAIPGTAPLRITATSRAGRAAQGAGIVAAELSLPLRNTRYALAGPIAGTLSTGIAEGIEAAGGELPDYTSISDLARSDNSDMQAEQTDAIDQQLLAGIDAPQMDAIDQQLLAPTQTPQVDPVDAMLLANTTPNARESDDSNPLLTALGVGGALLGGAAAARYVRGRIRAGQARIAATDTAERTPIVGTRVRRSKRGSTREQAAQRAAPVTDWFRDVVSPEAAERVQWRADRLTNTSLGPRVANLQSTGRYAGHLQRYTPTAPLAEAITKDLTPEEQQQLYDAVLAARAIDDLEMNGVQTAFTNDYTPAQLRQLVQSVTANPRLLNYYQGIQRVGRDQLQFAVKENLLSPQEAQEWASARPNWTKFNRALQEDRDFAELMSTAYTANRDTLGGASSKTEGGSLQAGAAENPLQALMGNWANLVRMAEVNKWRTEVLEAMDGVKDASGDVAVRSTRYQPGSTRDPNVHVIFRRNGRREAYRVTDPAISMALHIKPRAQAMSMLESMRVFFQQMTTGPIGSIAATGFNVAASPVFDAMSAITTRKPGQVLGPLNNLILAATRGKAHLGVLDPTQPLTSYYGGARYVIDELANITARAFERRLLQNNSMMRDLLGEDGMRTWAQRLRNYYVNSVKGFGDEQGVFSTTLYGSPDPGKPLVHQEHLAPSFTRAQIGKYYRDTAQSEGMIQQALQAGRSTWFAARATPVARTIALINEAMHNGQRYVTLANARYQRGYEQNLDKIVSETRRLGGDQSQHGASTRLNQLEGAVPYAAQSVQAMYEMGRTIRRYPVAAMANYGIALPAMLAVSYLGLIYDDEARERHYARTPEQQARILPMPGGMDMPITPELRPMLFGMRALFDELSGLNDPNGELNWDLIGAFENLVDGDNTLDDEQFYQTLESGMLSSLQETLPVNPLQIPLVQGAFGYAGVDPMTLRHGELRQAYTQRISGIDADKSQIGALTSAQWEAFISGTTGAAGAAMIDIANDFAAVAGDRGMSEGLDAAGRRWQDIQQRRIQNSPLRPLFGQYESMRAISDANWQLYNQRREGMEAAARVMSRDVMAGGATGQTQPLEMPAGTPRPDVVGTAAHTIGLAAQALQSDIRPLQQRMAALGMQAEGIRNAYTMRPEDQNRSVNELNRERQAISLQLLMTIRDREDYIGEVIGDPDFTFDGYDPSDYLIPVRTMAVPSQ